MTTKDTISFQGREYFDDRMFVLYLCKGKVTVLPDNTVKTKIYHEDPPDQYLWCVVTYRNCIGYPAFRVDSFYKKEDAISYIKLIEPQSPLISLNGESPQNLLPYDDYLIWKKKNNFKEYDYCSLYTPGGENAREIIIQAKANFKGIR